MPLNPSVSTISAPYAFKILRLSIVIVSGRVSIALYPFIAATDAIPIPVFPEVGSIIVAPGFKSPFSSASSIIDKATLSFTEPVGLKYSSFAITFTSLIPDFFIYL